ncbi:hypothetical protein G4O51_09660 [Candidatus Bathyarchaeota archaeon A05DMB-2]|jgi:hypothetical protein|nr:hypothetical protein [Candidatus Bathyarchaeota archaeon A05DMB-2]
MSTIQLDYADMEMKLKCYVDRGRVAGGVEVKTEPLIAVKPDVSLIKPLKRISFHEGGFIAVDCSTRALKRANNWGIYLMRASCATVKGRSVDWNYSERICTVIGDAHVRRSYLQDFRIELESQVALRTLNEALSGSYHVHSDVRSMYLLLDGGGYFGGERKFRVSLYEECEKNGIRLLAISKNSPSLHDEKGRDLVATTYMMAPYDIWVYYPVKKADKDKSLYGDIAIVKLCAESSHVFRCDIMDYLTQQDISEMLSPLTSVSEDPRCIGYPISLYLAHEFSAPSDSMLLSYHDQIEEQLDAAGLLDALKNEERSCSFADEIHGVKHAFEWEWWNDQY